MDSLRVNNGVKIVEVNDAGECIAIPIGDVSFYERFGNLAQYFDQKKNEIDRQGKELSEKYKDKLDDDVDKIVETVRFYADLCREVCVELDKLFGEGCCRKVFPGIEVPGAEMISDFFAQITPLMQKYFKERSQKINSKYNRDRKGATV